MASSEAYIDVVELCGILQCLGFHVKSIDTNCDRNSSNDGTRTVIVDCRTSGLHVVLEHGNLTCSCPTFANQQNSGVWQVSGITGGKQLDKEFGSSILGSLPRSHRERLTAQLQDIVRGIKQHHDDTDRHRDGVNRSNSMIDINTPDKRHLQLKADTPTMYRSLDTLTAAPPAAAPAPLPAPGPLLKHLDNDTDKVKPMCARQSTYTLSTPDNSRRRNKTSSPILQKPSSSVLEGLVAAERTAEELRTNLSKLIRELTEDGRGDSSSSLALDVSKISVLKVPDNTKIQFASSPNLSEFGIQEELAKRLRGIESSSMSNLATKSATKEAKPSKFRRISPNLFRSNNSTSKVDKDKQTNNKNSKLTSLFKPKAVTAVRAGTASVDGSPNLSGSKKKYSHIKSTIPRPAASKKE